MSILDGLRRRLVRRYYSPGYGVQVANLTIAELYRTQPNLRASVSFLSDNAAQVPLKIHDRVSNDDRPRVLDSPAALLLQHPNDDMTIFELKRATYSDLFLYGACMWLVLPDAKSDSGWQIRHIPSTWITEYRGAWAFAPESIVITHDGQRAIEVPRDKFILFHSYDPNDPLRGASPAEALQDVLYEQVESNRFRRQMWKRGGRFNTYITRPKDVEKWTDESFERFRSTWRNSWAGDAGADAGGTPILEDGMELRQVQFNSRDAQWADAKKLTREDVASVYHFNPALLWPGNGQTYASAKDNARALYNDALGPILMEVANRIDQKLLPMVGEQPSHYVAYDITIKTEGTFEEKIAALQAATGAPILTRNEARAKLDLPAIEDGDQLITPLNVLQGNPEEEQDNGPEEQLAALPMVKSEPVRFKAAPYDEDEAEFVDVYREFFKHQRAVLLPKLGAAKKNGNIKAAAWWDSERWNKELSEKLHPVALKQTTKAAKRTLAALGISAADYREDRTTNYVKAMCDQRAEFVNTATKSELDEVEDWEGDEDAERATYSGVFDLAESDRAESAGAAFACAVAGFGAIESARQCAPSNAEIVKTWVVTSGNPRKSHAAMNGETVPYKSEFSNGSMWPGDTVLDAADVANCKCQLEITIP